MSRLPFFESLDDYMEGGNKRKFNPFMEGDSHTSTKWPRNSQGNSQRPGILERRNWNFGGMERRFNNTGVGCKNYPNFHERNFQK